MEAYLTAGRIPDAEKTLDSAVKANPKDVDALLQRSQVYLRAGKLREAEADLTRVLQYRWASAEVHHVLANVHKSRGAPLPQMRELEEEALKQDPNLLPARIELAQLLVDTKRAKAALDILDQTPPEQKGNLAVTVQRNWALLAAGKLREANESITQALTEDQGAGFCTAGWEPQVSAAGLPRIPDLT